MINTHSRPHKENTIREEFNINEMIFIGDRGMVTRMLVAGDLTTGATLKIDVKDDALDFAVG